MVEPTDTLGVTCSYATGLGARCEFGAAAPLRYSRSYVPALKYYPLLKADMRSLDFVVTRFFNKSLQVNEYWQWQY